EAVLSRVARRTVLEDGLSPNERHAVYECLLLLAETRLALGRPDAALAALDTIPDDIPEPQRVDRLRLIALLWTNHLDRAAELDTPAAVWLDGLERCIGEPHATDVAA